jgi:hypothetical protein
MINLSGRKTKTKDMLQGKYATAMEVVGYGEKPKKKNKLAVYRNEPSTSASNTLSSNVTIISNVFDFSS